jgi:hypothetical protein
MLWYTPVPIRLPLPEEPTTLHAAQDKHLTTATFEHPPLRSLHISDVFGVNIQPESDATRPSKLVSARHKSKSPGHFADHLQLTGYTLTFLLQFVARSFLQPDLGKRCYARTSTESAQTHISRLLDAEGLYC